MNMTIVNADSVLSPSQAYIRTPPAQVHSRVTEAPHFAPAVASLKISFQKISQFPFNSPFDPR